MNKIEIYGDNVIECHRAAVLVSRAVRGNLRFSRGPLFAPIFCVHRDDHILYEIQLFPGHGRWIYDVQQELIKRGAPLREAPDAVLIQRIDDRATPLLAIEFCSALPAGNQAWQRAGRVLSCAEAKVPLLQFTEIGGIELGKTRKSKASRFPNPLVPFAYLTLTDFSGSLALPVYEPSPTITDKYQHDFKECFGTEEAKEIVKAILDKKDFAKYSKQLRTKVLKFTQELVKLKRRSGNTLTADQWKELFNLNQPSDKAAWFLKNSLLCKKKISIPTSKTFERLKKQIEQLRPAAIGSSDLPFCMLPKNQRKKLGETMRTIYDGRISSEFIEWIKSGKNPLVIVWIAGFKPRGDDSRPDRGLVPLIRMVFGHSAVDVLAIVYGPGKPEMWKELEKNMWQLAKENGLWEAIVHLSDAILIATKDRPDLKSLGLLTTKRPNTQSLTQLFLSQESNHTFPKKFGEHDVDTVLHLLFSIDNTGSLHECICNPPGGDWSGVSLFDDEKEYRWTSLPRAPGKVKRPDHIFQIDSAEYGKIFLIVESKKRPSDVKEDIRELLVEYVSRLFESTPQIYRVNPQRIGWTVFSDAPWNSIKDYKKPTTEKLVGCAAFISSSPAKLDMVIDGSKCEVAMGLQFNSDGTTTLHLKATKAEFLKNVIPIWNKAFNKWLKIKEH